MSGGKFDYVQYRFTDIIETLRSEIDRSGTEKDEKELYAWYDEAWYGKYPEEKFNYKYPEEVLTEFEKAIRYLKVAQIYAQRCDWILSGDDGDESFLRRLEEDLKEIGTNREKLPNI